MQNRAKARYEEPFFNGSEAGEDFEIALSQAARQNARSMNELHDAVKVCVVGLRKDGMQCEAVILTIKSCVRHIGHKHAILGSYNVAGSDLLVEQIVRWTIIEFYKSQEEHG